ncbi:MAG: TlyA family RNA methyltransferase [Candidatus Saccharicenans sp.]|nr:MAG: TlyA family rRNA (cytidine-2'-O)-methyltransferase [Candidatus Aminicenantes bacterium]HEK86612.1 TlyA family RNA methyltransferase [Candidatus Aminicenantes bacterium]
MGKIRLDMLLLKKGLAASREKAQALILSGKVLVNGQPVFKAGHLVSEESTLTLEAQFPYVSRAGAKLEQAIRTFSIEVAGKVALDIGISTGGFSDCLLQFGARKIYAVDVNCKQIDWKLRQDNRLVIIEKNARYLLPEDLPERPDITTIDVSFISVLKILPAVKNIMTAGDLLVLIKPQFEAGRNQVGKKGIVRDKKVQAEVLLRILSGAQSIGFALKDLIACETLGQKGNQEYFAWFRPDEQIIPLEKLENLILELTTDGNQKEN